MDDGLRLFFSPHRNFRLVAHAAVRLADRNAGHGSSLIGSLCLGCSAESRLGSQSTVPLLRSYIASLSQPLLVASRSRIVARLSVEKPTTHELYCLSINLFPYQHRHRRTAAKTLIQQRMKQAGVRWSREGALSLLAFCDSLLSDCWHQIPI